MTFSRLHLTFWCFLTSSFCFSHVASVDFESKQVVVGMLRGGLSGNHLIAYFKKTREQPVESPDCKSDSPSIEITNSVGSIHFFSAVVVLWQGWRRRRPCICRWNNLLLNYKGRCRSGYRDIEVGGVDS